MKTVSWPSVALFAIAACFFGFLGYLRRDAIVGIAGPAVTFFVWLLQGPVSSLTGQSMFPPAQEASRRQPSLVDLAEAATVKTPTLVPITKGPKS